MNADKQQVLKERSIRTQGSFRNAVRSANKDAAHSYIAWGLQEVRLMISIIVQL